VKPADRGSPGRTWWMVLERMHGEAESRETGWKDSCELTYVEDVKKGKGSWICIAPNCENLASEALRHGSHSFYAATTPHLPLPCKAFTRHDTTTNSDNSRLIAAYYSFINPQRMKG